MEITKQQVKSIIEKAPLGTNPRDIVEGLIKKGYNLEGLDPLTTSVFREQAKQVEVIKGNQFQEKPKPLWEKALDIASSVIGGKKLAQGAGLALTAPSVQNSINEAQKNLINTQTQLLQRLKTERQEGGDVSKTIDLLKLNQLELEKIADVSSDFAESLPTSKEVVGSATRLAGTLAGGAIASKAGGVFGVGEATTSVGGAVRGFGAGATAGAIEGGVQGVGIAAEQDKSTKDLIIGGALGATGGAVAGGVLGGALGAISGAIRGRSIRRQDFSKILATPKETPTSRAQAIQEGRLEDPTLFKKAELAFSSRDKQLAESIDDVVSPDATLGQNVDAIRKKVGEINIGVTDYIKANKVPLNMNQLRSKLMTGKSDLRLIFASDSSAEKTYNAVVDAFMNQVKSGDTLGVFKARQELDKIPAIKKLLDSDVVGENARREIVKAVRSSANDYVSTLLPKGNQFKDSLLKEHLMLEALTNIAEKGQKIIGKNKLQLLVKEYPFINQIIGAGVLTAGLGALGVGGSNSESAD